MRTHALLAVLTFIASAGQLSAFAPTIVPVPAGAYKVTYGIEVLGVPTSASGGVQTAQGTWTYATDGKWSRTQGQLATASEHTKNAASSDPRAVSISSNPDLSIQRECNPQTGSLDENVSVRVSADGPHPGEGYGYPRLARLLFPQPEGNRTITEIASEADSFERIDGTSDLTFETLKSGMITKISLDAGIIKSVTIGFPSKNSLSTTVEVSETRIVEGVQVPWDFTVTRSASGVVLESLRVRVATFESGTEWASAFPLVPEEPAMVSEDRTNGAIVARAGMTRQQYEANQ